MPRTKTEHLDRTTSPKRILALDGGGIRGILTLEFLGAIEGMLRQRSGRKDFLLCDYFDLIGGTSTGSIIAAGLACGMTVDELKLVYRDLGTKLFRGSVLRQGLFAPKFSAQPVRAALEEHLGATTTLADKRVRTGLMIMTKRLDTGSPWPLHNHPDARYAKQDGKLLLAQVVRASTAAPTYFTPERVAIERRNGATEKGVFVDGGVSPFNDPALQLLMLAALQGHGFQWAVGEKDILLVSCGTGTFQQTHAPSALTKMIAAQQGMAALFSLMDDCGQLNLTLLQWLTRCLTPWVIDRAIGDMKLDSQNGPKLATYARYDVLLREDWLKDQIAVEIAPDEIAKVATMDDPANIDQLVDLGMRAAATQVQADHFPARFDVA